MGVGSIRVSSSGPRQITMSLSSYLLCWYSNLLLVVARSCVPVSRRFLWMSDKRKRRCLLHELHKFVILPKHPNLSTSHPPFYLLAHLPIFFTVSFSSYRLPWARSPSINSLTMSLRPVHSAAARKETRSANASSLSFSVLSGGVTSTPMLQFSSQCFVWSAYPPRQPSPSPTPLSQWPSPGAHPGRDRRPTVPLRIKY